MSTRYRFRQFDISPDLEPDADPITYAVSCAVCSAAAVPSESPDTTTWITSHLRDEPEHLTYRETVVRPYRAAPGEWR